jgi:hypothetical protein
MKFKDFKTEDEWQDYCLTQLTNCKDHEFAIVKGHILMEYLLNYFIEQSNTEKKIQVRRFTFNHKVRIYEIFCTTSLAVPYLDFINMMRNEIAHEMGANDEMLKEFYKMGYRFLKGDEKYEHKFTVELHNTINSLTTILAHLFSEIESHFEFNTGLKEFREANAKKALLNLPYNVVRDGMTPQAFQALQDHFKKESKP